jgi:hypothetical protein
VRRGEYRGHSTYLRNFYQRGDFLIPLRWPKIGFWF